MFIRCRKSNQSMSYQLMESYRDGGKVRHRVLANLGRYPTIDEALHAFRERVARREGSMALYERGYNNAGRRLTEEDHQHALAQLARARAELARIEAVVSEMGHVRRISDTTPAPVLHRCEQCNGEPDGQERLRLIGAGDDAEEVWLHPQCWSFWCGYRGAVLSNRPNGAPPKVQSQPPTGRPST